VNVNEAIHSALREREPTLAFFFDLLKLEIEIRLIPDEGEDLDRWENVTPAEAKLAWDHYVGIRSGYVTNDGDCSDNYGEEAAVAAMTLITIMKPTEVNEALTIKV
jgi:hypothetical protein